METGFPLKWCLRGQGEPGHGHGPIERKNNDTPEQTLDRLFHKHLTGKGLWKKEVPHLNSTNTTTTVEQRPKQALAALANPNGDCRDSDGPMIIASYLGV